MRADIEFSPEDASRTEPEFLAEVVEAVIAAGAKTVNIPDTVGYAILNDFANLITYLKANVKNIDDAVISVHCHNDLGLAVANLLAAVSAGARQIECTINGIMNVPATPPWKRSSWPCVQGPVRRSDDGRAQRAPST